MNTFNDAELASLAEMLGKTPEEEVIEEDKHAISTKRHDKHVMRRLKSEKALEEIIDWHFEKGTSYHVMSFGDVDILTYLRHILKQQPLEYALISTWCMAAADIEEIDGWLTRGLIENLDFYVGEIFGANGRYSEEWKLLKALQLKHGGRAAIFRNHAKIMAGFGESFDFAIESSANVNTNPRCENATIIVDTELALFYKDFYDGIRSFDKSFNEWKPYVLRRQRSECPIGDQDNEDDAISNLLKQCRDDLEKQGLL